MGREPEKSNAHDEINQSPQLHFKSFLLFSGKINTGRTVNSDGNYNVCYLFTVVVAGMKLKFQPNWYFLSLPVLWIILKSLFFLSPAPVFFLSYFDDLLIIPFVMGTALWIQQYFIKPDFVYRSVYIALVWLYFSLLFEGIIPWFTNNYTADLYDLPAYACGAIYFYCFINKPAQKNSQTTAN
nr:hypothetical protein [Pseudopedobacter sp.]